MVVIENFRHKGVVRVGKGPQESPMKSGFARAVREVGPSGRGPQHVHAKRGILWPSLSGISRGLLTPLHREPWTDYG